MKQGHHNRGASEKLALALFSVGYYGLSDIYGNIAVHGRVPVQRGVDGVGGVKDRGCSLVREGQVTVLYIRIAGGTGAGPDEVGWFFHRLS